MSKTTAPTINDMIDSYVDVSAQIEALEEKRSNLATALVARIGVGNTAETTEAKVTITQNTSYVMDYETFVATARPGLVRQLTKKVLDNTKFQALLKADLLPPDVRALVQQKTSAPYPRLTLKKR